jgi:hypothetical protein
MIRMKHFFIVIGLLFFHCCFINPAFLFGQIEQNEFTEQVESEIRNAKDDSVKIERLFDLAYFHFDYLDNSRISDSICHIALDIAEASHSSNLQLAAYDRYLKCINLNDNFAKALEYALKAEQISFHNASTDISLQIYSNLVKVYLSGYDYDKALEYSYKSLTVSASAENNSLKARSYLDIGKCQEGKNRKIEAFRNYLNAENLAEQVSDSNLLINCFDQLSNFYNLNKLFKKASIIKLRQIELLEKAKQVDSIALMWAKYDLQEIDVNANSFRLNEKSMMEILDFARRWNHKRMTNFEIALIRTYLIESGQINQLKDLYIHHFSQELAALKSNDPGLYFRLNALFCENENKIDSALYHFKKAETVYKAETNIILQSKFNNRFGQFLVRQGKMDLAISKFLTSYELAKTASYFDYMLTASKELESLYAGKGDYKNAYYYAVQNKLLADSINKMSEKDQLLVMEIDHETQQRERATELEKQLISKRHSIQYSAMVIIFIVVFIVLLMLGSLKVPEWIIKSLGFFTFIFLFEFIILISDQKIIEITHEEPWKILLIKIFLIAFMLPLHHWVEKRMVAFLLNPLLFNIGQYPLKRKLKEKVQLVKKIKLWKP